METAIKVGGFVWKYSEESLNKMFKSISNSKDWRAPIEKWISRYDLDIAREAVRFYTATEIEIVDTTSTHYKIYSVGYRMGPAGDH